MNSPQYSPNGRSRYGRTLRPKTSSDFRNVDDIPMEDYSTPKQQSQSAKSPKKRANNQAKLSENVLKATDFNPLNNLSVQVVNNLKVNLQRGSDTAIKDRKFFKSSTENKLNHANMMDVSKVFRIIASNPASDAVVPHKGATPKNVKTYCNKSKTTHTFSDYVESFALPDEPFVPITNYKPAIQTLPRNNKIDLPSNNRRGDTTINNLFDQEYQWSLDMELTYKNFISCESPRINNNDICMNASTPIVKEKPKDHVKINDSITSEEKNLSRVVFENNIDAMAEHQKAIKVPKKRMSFRASGSPDLQNVRKTRASIRREQSFLSDLETTISDSSFDISVSEVEGKVKKGKKSRARNSAKVVNESKIEAIPTIEIQEIHEEQPSARITRRSLRNAEVPVSEEDLTSTETSSVVEDVVKEEILDPSPESISSSEPLEVPAEETSEQPKEQEAAAEVKQEPGGVHRKKSKKRLRGGLLFELNVINNESQYGLGDIVWARFSTYPYWPGIIMENAESNSFMIERPSCIHPFYNVRFFGDKGRSSWIGKKDLLHFTNRDDLEKIAIKLQMQSFLQTDIKRFFYPHNAQIIKWTEGVQEAELLVEQQIEDRLDYCEKQDKAIMITKVENKKRKRQSSDTFKTRKILKIETDDESNAIVLKEKKTTMPAETVDAAPLQDVECIETELDLTYKESPKKLASSSSTKLSPGRRRPRSSINPVSMFASLKSEPSEDCAENEVSVSKTSSKSSTCSNFPTSLAEQSALVKRNNLFRGATKDKVCSVCLKSENVSKCEGLCGEFYHPDCILEVKKETIPKTPEQTKTVKEKDNSTVQIISVKSKKPLPALSNSPSLEGMALAEKIDFKLKQILKLDRHEESTDSSSDEFTLVAEKDRRSNGRKTFTHVTADSSLTNEHVKNGVKCPRCRSNDVPLCKACNSAISKSGVDVRQHCSLQRCTSYYHVECLSTWPQTQWSISDTNNLDSFTCPRHVCHTCVSDDPKASVPSKSNFKIVRCLKCPATYHSYSECIPAGTVILSITQIICPRHLTLDKIKRRKRTLVAINANWCFICSQGGDLICCETCPASVHVECLMADFNADDNFFCEDCQSGRLPLYDEVVWVKCGNFRWWPAIIIFPNEVPHSIRNSEHNDGEFVVKFFGTHDYFWVGRGRTFLFQEDDTATNNCCKRNRVDQVFKVAVDEAVMVYNLKKEFRISTEGRKQNDRPPPYIRIMINRPVGKVKQVDGNLSNSINPCSCDPRAAHPCGPDSNCLNRLLLTECDPELCPAGTRCNNQRFEKREYPPLMPYKTEKRGWGLKALAPLHKGQFVIEYVGEVIDEQEYKRRIQRMHQEKKDNYYFLTIDKDRTIDAGPRGNMARFMNHSCAPNCETQKWTVNGDTRVGIFAKYDLPADTELTFNYNLECVGEQKKMCMCGAENCTGFIGDKAKQQEEARKRKSKSKKDSMESIGTKSTSKEVCFKCGKGGQVGPCNNRDCTKFYHLKCVGLSKWPKGTKWTCPRHSCNFCTKRTIRCCFECTNSFCPSHSEGLIRFDQYLGFICVEHDPLLSKDAEES